MNRIGVCHGCGEIHDSDHDLCDNCWYFALYETVRRYVPAIVVRVEADL